MKASASLALGAAAAKTAARAADEALEGLAGAPATLAVLFASLHYSSIALATLDAIRAVTGPVPLIGCVAEGVIGTGREVEEEPAVSLLLASGMGQVETFGVEHMETASGSLFAGHRFEPGGGPTSWYATPTRSPSRTCSTISTGMSPGPWLWGGWPAEGLQAARASSSSTTGSWAAAP